MTADVPVPALPLRVDVSPQGIEGGSEIELTVAGTDGAAADYVGVPLRFLDAGGSEVGRSELIEIDGRVQSLPLVADAPTEPGEHCWRVVFELDDDDPKTSPGIEFRFAVQPHQISIGVWGAPFAVEAGAHFPLNIGLKCPCGCNSQGWPFAVLDSAGHELATGRVGTTPWQGTAGLHYATVDLVAPSTPGRHEWTVVSKDPGIAVPHVARVVGHTVNTTPAAEFSLRLEAVDAVSGEPVAGARVVAHPHRAFTDATGRAWLRVPSGKYTLFVSGKQYFPHKLEGEVSADTDIRVALHVDREFSEADAWA